ncbi:DoxX family protein [Schlesneria paludicola]|uniref:DoxX family protein n=1 Tax=Schlesneria paludicola TaxID=360056 RepID=UPI00029AD00E|nr:DoxX family protein [Schlesneria paludicola]
MTAVATSERPASDGPGISSVRLWTGRILTGIAGLFLLMDGSMKIIKPEIVVKMTTDLGYPESLIMPLGIVLITSTVLYLIPATSLLGAVLLCGYLGGAVATHVRVQNSTFEIVFPAIIGAIVWGGLCLRYPRMSAMIFGPR